MNTGFLRSQLTEFRAVEHFAYYFMGFFDEDGFHPEVRKFMVGYCEDIVRLSENLYDELVYDVLLKIDYLDFFASLDKEYKVHVLNFNRITAINNEDNDELLSLLKDLGEEKALKTLCIFT